MNIINWLSFFFVTFSATIFRTCRCLFEISSSCLYVLFHQTALYHFQLTLCSWIFLSQYDNAYEKSNRWDFEKKVSLNSWTRTSELGGSCAFKNKRSFNLTLCRGSKRLLLRLSRIFYLEDLFLHSRLQGQEEWVSRDGGFSCLSVLISLRLISY